MMNANPFMNMWLQAAQQMVQPLPNICQPNVQQPALFNPLEAIQQGMAAWQQMLNPQAAKPAAEFPAPKITVMTIELGDMKPYMEAANQMIQMWQPQMMQAFTRMVQR